MHVLVVGGGGREHALAWKIAQSPEVQAVFAAPGNPGIARMPKGRCAAVGVNDFEGIEALIREEKIALTVIGPEDPLCNGMADRLSAKGHTVFGPGAGAARLEGSKAFAKDFMARHHIPTAAYAAFEQAGAALDYVHAQGLPIVVKADGLAAGKGVTVCHTVAEAHEAINRCMVDKAFGDAGSRVIIEECLTGEEASILAFCDGTRAIPMVTSQDHKPVYDGDAGPNTGGMGAYSPAPVVTDALQARIEQEVLAPVVAGMAAEGTPYRGILYAGLMITDAGPKVIEFNVRFGDPETQVVLPRMTSEIVPIFMACACGGLKQAAIAYDDGACVTVVMASGGYPGSYEKGKVITGIEEAEADKGVMVFHAGTRLDGDVLRTNGGRVLNVTAAADTVPEAIGKAYAAVEKIHFDNAHYRTDIGRKALDRLGMGG
ncbi:MAG: phosphoribosylamine--glycine ligase [Candidatus Hydrogenedentota bacterium]